VNVKFFKILFIAGNNAVAADGFCTGGDKAVLEVPCFPLEEERAERYVQKSRKVKAFRDSVKAKSLLLNQPKKFD